MNGCFSIEPSLQTIGKRVASQSVLFPEQLTIPAFDSSMPGNGVRFVEAKLQEKADTGFGTRRLFDFCNKGHLNIALTFVLLLVFFFQISSLVQAAQTQGNTDQHTAEAAKKSLGKSSGRKYPWYSTESDNPKFVPFPQERPQRSDSLQVREPGDWSAVFSFFFYLILLVFLALVAWGIVYLAMEFVPGLKQLSIEGVKEETDRKRRIETLPLEAQGEVGNLLGAAMKAIEQGDLRQAIILYFSFQLWELDKNECIRLHKGKTNHEYAYELNKWSELKTLYEQTMDLFEKTYFGEHPVIRSDFDAVWNSRQLFLNQLAARKQKGV